MGKDLLVIAQVNGNGKRFVGDNTNKGYKVMLKPVCRRGRQVQHDAE